MSTNSCWAIWKEGKIEGCKRFYPVIGSLNIKEIKEEVTLLNTRRLELAFLDHTRYTLQCYLYWWNNSAHAFCSTLQCNPISFLLCSKIGSVQSRDIWWPHCSRRKSVALQSIWRNSCHYSLGMHKLFIINFLWLLLTINEPYLDFGKFVCLICVFWLMHCWLSTHSV